MIFNEIKCHFNTCLGLVGGDASPASPLCPRLATVSHIKWALKETVFLLHSKCLKGGRSVMKCSVLGRNEGGQGGRNSPGAESIWGRQITGGDAEWLLGCQRAPTMSHKHFLQYSTFASERPQLQIWGGKLASCPGRHLISLRPW